MQATDVAGVAYGRPAVERLATQVLAAKAGDPLAPVTVVVPSNYAAVAGRRALAARPGGIANVTFLTLYRLAERLGGPTLAAAGRRPVSSPVLAAAVRAVLDEAPGVFAPVAQHPATERALVQAHRELRAVTADALEPVAALSGRAGDVVRIHRAVQARLEADWFDEHDLLLAATEVVRAGADVGPVIVHLLQDLSAAGAAFLGELAPGHVNIGLTGVAAADASVLAAHRRAGFDVDGMPAVTPARCARIVSTSDPDDEVRAAIRQVVAWMHEGVNLGNVAILYGSPDPYGRLVHEQLTAAGLPFNGTPVRDVGDLLFGRTLRALLELPDTGWSRTEVLAVLTGAPLLGADGRRVPSRAWERLSRDAGVVKGDDWEERLGRYAAKATASAADSRAEGENWRAERLERDAARAGSLAAWVRQLRVDLAAGATAGSWAAMVEWAKSLVTTYIGDEGRRSSWPEEEQSAAQRVEAALDRLAGLDAVGPPPTLEVFRRTFDAELAQSLRRLGRLGDGVLVGHVSMAGGLVLDRVLVLGLSEGSYPPRRLEDSLLPDRERALAGGELPLRAERVHDDHRHLLAALAAADEAVLCQPRGDLRRAGERPASRWLLGDAAALAGVERIRSDELAGHVGTAWFTRVPSFLGGLAAAPVLATDQELRLAAIARGRPDHGVLAGDARLAAALEVVHARRGDAFTRFDGNLGGLAGEIPRPVRVSASALQAWANCPHRYFLQYVLKVVPVEEPEDLFEITPADKGTLVHAVLEDLVRAAIAEGHASDGWGVGDRARLTTIAQDHFDAFQAEGRTGRALLWGRDVVRILKELDEVLDRDSARLAAGYEPLAVEHDFTGVEVALPGGHVLEVRGFIDRVDRRPDGGIEVLDYKSGSIKDHHRSLCPEAPHGNGELLQLYLYARAAERDFPSTQPVSSQYWFTRHDKFFGYPVTPDLAAKVERVLELIVESIAGGVFPARPAETPSYTHNECPFCRPDGLSGTDRRREWERKRLDPLLRAYTELCEQEALDDHA